MQFLSELTLLATPHEKPSVFHSSCTKLPKDFKPNLLEPLPALVFEHIQNNQNADTDIPMQQVQEINIANFQQPVMDLSRIQTGCTVVGATSNMINFIFLLVITSPASNYFNSKHFYQKINYKGKGEGAVAVEIRYCFYSVWDTFHPLKIDGLIDALRKYGPPYWHKADYYTWHTLDTIVDTILSMLNSDLSGTPSMNNHESKQDIPSISPIEQSDIKITNYFTGLNCSEGYSPIKTLFNINIIYNCYCNHCSNQWKIFATKWAIKIPLIGTSANYWHRDNDVIVSASVQLIPTQLLTLTYDDLIKLIMIDVDNLDEQEQNKITFYSSNKTFILIDKKPKYMVYVTSLAKQNNGYNWQAQHIATLLKQMTLHQYCMQRTHSIVIESIDFANNVHLNINTIFNVPYTFVNEYYEITQTKTILPKEYPKISWTQATSTKIEIKNEDNVGEIHPLIEQPPGNDTINLIERVNHIIHNGYVTFDQCPNCKVNKTITKKIQIHKIPPVLLMYLDQGDSAILSVQWPINQRSIQLALTTKHTHTVQIDAFISQHNKQSHTSYWRNNEQKWFVMDGHKVLQNVPATSQKALLLFLTVT